MATPLNNIKLTWAFAACGVAWTTLQAYIINSFGFTWYAAVTDSLISSGALTVACWLISNIFRFYHPARENYIFLLVGLAAACTALSRYGIPPIIADPVYTVFNSRSLTIRFFTNFLAIGWMAMISLIWYSQQDQKENEKRKAEAEKLARDAELYNLRQQLQPHFLFNSLNSINALIGFKPDEARKMIHQLSDFLRGTLKKDDQQLVTLAEELQHLNLYLDIEKVRFGHRLQTEISCDERSREAMMPSLVLQPIVENAIKFGLYDTIGEVVVSIRAQMEDSYLILLVQNPYDPQTARPQKGTGFGLSGLKRRLYLLYARNDLVETHQGDHIFTTTIRIPQP